MRDLKSDFQINISPTKVGDQKKLNDLELFPTIFETFQNFHDNVKEDWKS